MKLVLLVAAFVLATAATQSSQATLRGGTNTSSKKNWLLRYLLPAIAIFGAAIGWSSPSDAFVQEFVIDSMNTATYSPIPMGSSNPGTPVSYTIYTGRIFGALNPGLPQNAVITDIGLASPVYMTPTPPSGDATYISQFSIVTPTDPTQRSGLLIYEVSNRGGSAISTGALIQGATYVQSGWQGDLLAHALVLARCLRRHIPASF